MTIQHEKLSELRRLRSLLEAEQQEAARLAIEATKTSRYRTLARPEQLPPDGNWRIWLVISGRGFGKTFLGAGWLAEQARLNPGTEWAIVAPTFTDVRRTCVEGPSGFLKALDYDPKTGDFYNRSNGQITLSNGSRIHLISADEPDRARGLNLSGAWLDEMSSFRYDEIWTEGLAPALRIGDPRVVITTTPRPTKLIKEFVSRTDGSVVVTRGSTFDNAANLSEAALAELRARYEGTRLGRQELYGEIVDDQEGSLFKIDHIESARVKFAPDLVRVVVAVDPAVTSGEDSDLTGIVVVAKGADGRGYVLADRSCRDTPFGWAQRVANIYEEFNADRVVAEKNQGGDFIEQTIRAANPLIAFKGVTAYFGKKLRAEPIGAQYEQGRISHVGYFPELEEEMTSWVPGVSKKSPDRLDALVHGLTELGLVNGGSADRYFASIAPACPYCGFPNNENATTCSSCHKQIKTDTPATISSGFPLI